LLIGNEKKQNHNLQQQKYLHGRVEEDDFKKHITRAKKHAVVL